MKFKRCMTAICSSALVLGLSFLLYPQTPTATDTKATPTAAVAPETTPEATSPSNESTGTPTPTATPAPTPTPEIEHHKLLTGDLSTPLSVIADVVTSYITSYYDNDFESVSALVTDASLLNAALMENNSKHVS